MEAGKGLLAIDGSSTHEVVEHELFYMILTVSVFLYFKVSCSNNEAEYEGLNIGLVSALNKGIQKLHVKRFKAHYSTS